MSEPTPPEITWQDAATWPIGGRGWADADTYARFPEPARERVPEAVWNLSRHCAGLSLHGRLSSAESLQLRWRLTSPELAMNHMAATGQSGLDIYLRRAGGDWFYHGTARPTAQDSEATIGLPGPGPHEFLLYLPLYNGLESLSFGLPAGASIEQLPPLGAPKRPVAVYGTSITQGGCASRTGMLYTSIIQRRLERDFVNLGFSGSARMEQGVTEQMAELDPALFVLDFTRNTGGLEDDVYNERLRYLLTSLRNAHPEMPILAVCDFHINPAVRPTKSTRRLAAIVEEFQVHDPLLHYYGDDSALGDDGEGTVDGTHPTDLGFLRIADALTPTIAALLD